MAEHGDWTAHNLHVGAGVYTRGPRIFGDEFKLRRTVTLVESLVGRPWDELRILDLGCLEGLYACEFALRGASVVGIEGRSSNLARAEFAREALGLDRLELVEADVRDLSRERHGGFDVVLCTGILYHLDTPGVFELAESVRAVCDGVAIVDTHVSYADAELARLPAEAFWVDPATLGPFEARSHRGVDYWGRAYTEHLPDSTPEERAGSGWASIGNFESFWPSRASLFNLLADSGFASVLEVHAPRLAYPPDRVTLVALGGGGHPTLRTTSLIDEIPDVPYAEG